MKVVRKLEKIEQVLLAQKEAGCAASSTVLALGAFDGLHRGHMEVVRRGLALAQAMTDTEPGAFTFLASPSGAKSVLTLRDKEKVLKQAGVCSLFSLDFEAVRDLTPAVFFHRVLLSVCNAKALVCGEDFRFGKDAAGDVPALSRLCQEAGILLEVVPPVLEGEEKVSSTRIRAAIQEGDLPLAQRLLGRPFGFSQEVIHGNHIGGKVLGTPTINQTIPENFVLPPFGVYASFTRVDGVPYFGVTNVGVKPTIGSDRVLAETWMPDFSGNLYGKRVRLVLLKFLRPEEKFPSLEALKAAIHKNAEEARALTSHISHPEQLFI